MNEDIKFDGEASGPMSRNELKQLGDGEVAYIKQLDLDLAQKLFPALRGKLEGIDLYAVLGADGTPLALTDSRNAAIANAIENDLVPLSVHYADQSSSIELRGLSSGGVGSRRPRSAPHRSRRHRARP